MPVLVPLSELQPPEDCLHSHFIQPCLMVRKTAPQSEVQHLVDHLKEVPLKKKSIGSGAPYKKKPWSDWDDKRRGAAAELYRSVGFTKCTLQYGSTCPPESTLRDWGKKLAAQGFIAPIGRPGKLSVQEDKALTEYFNAVRAEGGSVDWHSVADGSPLHCEWHLWLSFTEPTKPYTPQHFWECPRNLPQRNLQHKIRGAPRNFP